TLRRSHPARISHWKFCSQPLARVGGEFLGKVRGHFWCCELTQPAEILGAKSQLHLGQALLECCKIGLRRLKLDFAPRARLFAAKTCESATSGSAQWASPRCRPCAETRALKREPAPADKTHHQFEEQIQKPNLK